MLGVDVNVGLGVSVEFNTTICAVQDWFPSGPMPNM
jgi:hypothetical protein